MVTKRQLMMEFKRRRGAMAIGALVGAAAAYTVISQGDVTTVAQAGEGLLDIVLSRSAPADLALYKIYGVFMIVGALLGAVIDNLLSKV